MMAVDVRRAFTRSQRCILLCFALFFAVFEMTCNGLKWFEAVRFEGSDQAIIEALRCCILLYFTVFSPVHYRASLKASTWSILGCLGVFLPSPWRRLLKVLQHFLLLPFASFSLSITHLNKILWRGELRLLSVYFEGSHQPATVDISRIIWTRVFKVSKVSKVEGKVTTTAIQSGYILSIFLPSQQCQKLNRSVELKPLDIEGRG